MNKTENFRGEVHIDCVPPSEKPKLTANILFSGIGCQERGIQNTGLFDFEVVSTSEINTYTIIAYAAIHCGLTNELIENYDYPAFTHMRHELTLMNIGYVPEKDKPYNWNRHGKSADDFVKKAWLACHLSKNLGDIRAINRLPYADLWTLSAPCTDISVAGKMRGLDPDAETRSSLIWQNVRLLKRAKETDTLPKYLLLENVKNLVGKKFRGDFDTFNELISDFGYNVYWQVINGKDCGIPQNRERVFAIYIRKDIDTGRFTFPKPFDNGLRLKDMLQDKVDEKYYINTPKAEKLIKKLLDDGVIGAEALDRQTDRQTGGRFVH